MDGARHFLQPIDASGGGRLLGIGERLMRLAPASTGALPSGDFRDWDAIDAWADDIAATLKGSPRTT